MTLLSSDDVAWLNWEPPIEASTSRRARPKTLARSLARWRPPQEIPSKHVPWLEHSDASLVLRPRYGGDWTLAGSALRVLHDPIAPHLSPYLVNESMDCLERSSAFPECSAVSRDLPEGQTTRICLELTAEKSEGVFAQVGVAQVQPDEAEPGVVGVLPTESKRSCGKLSVFTPLLSSVFFTAAGDIFGSSKIEVLDPGAHGRCLCHRADDWWSGAATWFLGGERRKLRIFMEVDLGKRPSVSFRLDTFHQAPVVVSLPPGVLPDAPKPAFDTDDPGPAVPVPWKFVVSITQGQTARIVELQLLCDGTVDEKTTERC